MSDSQPERQKSARTPAPRFAAPDPTPVESIDVEGRAMVRVSPDGEYAPPRPGNPENMVHGRSPLPHELYEARVSVIAALKAQGYTRRQIGKAMGMTASGVNWCIRKARELGHLKSGLEDALNELDNEAIPLAVEAFLHHLRAKDKDIAIATLEGRGLLPHRTKAKNEAGPGGVNMAFQFNFVTPDGQTVQADVKTLPGQVLGRERTE